MGKSRNLFPEEQAIIDVLKREKIFIKIGENGLCNEVESTAVLCSDDHTDMTRHHRKKITPIVHQVRVFGGPLAFHPGYKDYDPAVRDWIINNIRNGMSFKGNNDLCNYFHFACGMADHFGHKIKEVLKWVPDIAEFLINLKFLEDKNIHILSHTKKENEQNTYLADVIGLDRFIATGGLKNC